MKRLDQVDFPVDQQPEPFGAGEIGGSVSGFKFRKSFGHTVELQRLELIQGWMCQHVQSFLN